MDTRNRGCAIWLTGLSGAGKTTLAQSVFAMLHGRGVAIEMLDGDVVREHLSKGLGFTKDDRDANILRIAWVAQLLARHGVPSIVAAISPYREARDKARAMVEQAAGKGAFVEVYVDCPLDVCERRDAKGLYARARAGEIKHFTGIDDPYEPPRTPEIHLRTDSTSPLAGADAILRHLERYVWVA